MVHQIWHTNMNYSSYVASRRQNIGAKSLSQLENNGTTFSLAWTLSMSQITLVHWIMNNSTIDPWKVNLLPSQEHYDLKLDLVTLHVWVGPNALFFYGSTFILCGIYLFFFVFFSFQCDGQQQKLPCKWWVEEILIFHKIKFQNIFFSKYLWRSLNFLRYLVSTKTSPILMLRPRGGHSIVK